MATDNSNKVINKKDERYPDWLNFDKLRSEGIEYLGKLSGNLWTDHNVHDPGITILEMLCYALMDLGYRTSLPAMDLFAQDPDNPNIKDFFTGAQILSNSPLTILDYRRMLIDIPGVKNAWLEADNWLHDAERNPRGLLENFINPDATNCHSFLNGLYHVYVELEDNAEVEKKDIKDAITRALQSHRNLCEDFIDFVVLCKQEIGICATVDLEQVADAEKIYQQIIERLKAFFSPAPKFYTIQELLDKGKVIEEIHAGRPYDLEQSHGFIDVQELENIKLRKEVHLSDVYRIILDVEGVLAVRNLELKDCKGEGCSDKSEDGDWIFKVLKNHMANFSPSCSGFSFVKGGIHTPVNTAKYKAYFELGFNESTKALYDKSSPYLDLALPKGNYRSDLDSYYSIQNEFPAVYKIGNGQLLKDTPAARTAQALQLKGYLLFFDHLLADYLTQLTSVRSLLSVSQDVSEENPTPYPTNLYTVPDLSLLVRFSKEQLVENELQEGSILAFPVDKDILMQLVGLEEIVWKDLQQLVPYLFTSEEAAAIAVNQLSEDLSNDYFEAMLFRTKDGDIYFYVVTSSNDIVLLSKKKYNDELAALRDKDALMFAAVSTSNFYSYPLPDELSYTFYLSFGPAGNLDYLQLISNSETLFNKRKQQFLDHLLARFSERFTDFAILTYGSMDEDAVIKNEIAHKQKFLSNYPEISSNRGKAYDYSTNGWGNLNISGFEKRFKALAGISDWEKNNHCHFDVIPYEKEVFIQVKYDRFNVLKGIDKLVESESKEVFDSFVKALADRDNYHHMPSQYNNRHIIYVKDGHYRYEHPATIDKQEIDEAVDRLFRTFSQEPYNVEPSSYAHFVSLYNHINTEVLRRIEPVKYPSPDLPLTEELVKDIDDRKIWEPMSAGKPAELIKLFSNPSSIKTFADLNAFDVDAYSFDIRKETITSKFSVSNRQDLPRFLFHSIYEFNDSDTALLMGRLFLFSLADSLNYDYPQNHHGHYNIRVNRNGAISALESIEYLYLKDAEFAARKIWTYAMDQIYYLNVRAEVDSWRFQYLLGFPVQQQFLFNSRKEDYKTYDEAYYAALTLISSIEDHTVVTNDKNELEILLGQSVLAYYKLAKEEDASSSQQNAGSLLKLKTQMNRLVQKPADYESRYIIPEDPTVTVPAYLYRLYDKNTSCAYHKLLAVPPDEAAVKNALVKKYPGGYNVLEICYGGDIVHQRSNSSTQEITYHYQVKSRNRYYPDGRQLVLFESIKGYASEEEAEGAFRDNYMTILAKALLKDSYGTFISFSETVNNVPVGLDETVVFIPADTMILYGNHNEHAARELILLARAYPIRQVKKCSDDFKKLFQCDHSCIDEKPGMTESEISTEEKIVYYFVLSELIDKSINEVWFSEEYFDTAQDALNAYRLFISLLGYKGNYHVDYNCECEWRISIREILAVSLEKFDTKAAAWGEAGIEKFIAISQSDQGFHRIQHRETCCYSFYVSCGNAGIVHPCVYPSPQLRDNALHQLQRAGRKNYFGKSFSNLYNEAVQNFLAELSVTTEKDLFTVFADIQSGLAFAKQDGYKGVLITEELKRNLQDMAYYFPIKAKNISKGDEPVFRYYLELRLPTFGQHHVEKVKPCPCCKKQNVKCTCNIAWKSECEFQTFEEALELLSQALECLKVHDNYRAVFEDNCNEYRIMLHCATNKPIAYNPQCYTTPRQVSRAILQAKALINSEGLHLVEHILLRPGEFTKCKDEAGNILETDCPKCDDIIPPYTGTRAPTICEVEKDCRFSWPAPTIYGASNAILFTPGQDPYSFLATVVLPAWPQRFRTQENRQLLERMLYRESPAHVMLRIIWLKPHDLCMFEERFRDWNRYMSVDKKLCVDGDKIKNKLIAFLFNTTFSCLIDQEPCNTCVTQEMDDDPCNHSRRATPKHPYKLLDAVNELFCWREFDCNTKPVKEAEMPGPAVEPKPQQLNPQIQHVEGQEYTGKANVDDKDSFVTGRIKQYRQELKDLSDQKGEHPVVKMAVKFVKAPTPAIKYFAQVSGAILTSLRGDQSIDIPEAEILISNVMGYYLDRQIFKGKGIGELEIVAEDFSDFRGQGVDMDKIYKNWKPDSVKKHAPETDLDKIYNLLTGT